LSRTFREGFAPRYQPMYFGSQIGSAGTKNTTATASTCMITNGITPR
jgi:hypothetical protein